MGDGNAWTPLKALRRITDHLLDHLAEIEATLAGQPTVPDSWLGRTVTLESDWARFTEGDLNEATNRLLRYAELYRVRLGGLSAAELDLPRPSAWTVRQIAHHVAGVTYYARQVGDLAVRAEARTLAAARPRLARRGSVPAMACRRPARLRGVRLAGGDEGGEAVEDAVDAEVKRVAAPGGRWRFREGRQDLRVAVGVGGQGRADLAGHLRLEVGWPAGVTWTRLRTWPLSSATASSRSGPVRPVPASAASAVSIHAISCGPVGRAPAVASIDHGCRR